MTMIMTDEEWELVAASAELWMAREHGRKHMFPQVSSEISGVLCDHVLEAEERVKRARQVLYELHYPSHNR